MQQDGDESKVLALEAKASPANYCRTEIDDTLSNKQADIHENLNKDTPKELVVLQPPDLKKEFNNPFLQRTESKVASPANDRRTEIDVSPSNKEANIHENLGKNAPKELIVLQPPDLKKERNTPVLQPPESRVASPANYCKTEVDDTISDKQTNIQEDLGEDAFDDLAGFQPPKPDVGRRFPSKIRRKGMTKYGREDSRRIRMKAERRKKRLMDIQSSINENLGQDVSKELAVLQTPELKVESPANYCKTEIDDTLSDKQANIHEDLGEDAFDDLAGFQPPKPDVGRLFPLKSRRKGITKYGREESKRIRMRAERRKKRLIDIQSSINENLGQDVSKELAVLQPSELKVASSANYCITEVDDTLSDKQAGIHENLDEDASQALAVIKKRGPRYAREEARRKLKRAERNEKRRLMNEQMQLQHVLSENTPQRHHHVKSKRNPYSSINHGPRRALNPDNQHHAKLIKHWKFLRKSVRTKIRNIRKDPSFDESARISALTKLFLMEERFGAEYWHNVNFWKQDEKLSKNYDTYQEALQNDECLKISRSKRLQTLKEKDKTIAKRREYSRVRYWCPFRNIRKKSYFDSLPANTKPRVLDPNNKFHLPVIKFWVNQQKLIRAQKKALRTDDNLEEAKRIDLLLELFHVEERLGAENWHNVNFWTDNKPLAKEYGTYNEALREDQTLNAARANCLRLAQETNEEREQRQQNGFWWEEDDELPYLFAEENEQSFLSNDYIEPSLEYSCESSPESCDEPIFKSGLVAAPESYVSPSKCSLQNQISPEVLLNASVKSEQADEFQEPGFNTKPNEESLKFEPESSFQVLKPVINEHYLFTENNNSEGLSLPKQNHRILCNSKEVSESYSEETHREFTFVQVPMTSASAETFCSAQIDETPMDHNYEWSLKNHDFNLSAEAKTSHITFGRRSNTNSKSNHLREYPTDDDTPLSVSKATWSGIRCKSEIELKYNLDLMEEQKEKKGFDEAQGKLYCPSVKKNKVETKRVKKKTQQAMKVAEEKAETRFEPQKKRNFPLGENCLSFKPIIREVPNKTILVGTQDTAVFPPKNFLKETLILDSQTIQISKLAKTSLSEELSTTFPLSTEELHQRSTPVNSWSVKCDPLVVGSPSKLNHEVPLKQSSLSTSQKSVSFSCNGTIFAPQPRLDSLELATEKTTPYLRPEAMHLEIDLKQVSSTLPSSNATLPLIRDNDRASFVSCDLMSSEVSASSPTLIDRRAPQDEPPSTFENSTSVNKKKVFEQTLSNESRVVESHDDITIKEEFQEINTNQFAESYDVITIKEEFQEIISGEVSSD